MGNPLFATIITGLSFVCLSLSVLTVFLPYWGYFEESNRGYGSGNDRGHFSPWLTCREQGVDRTKCSFAHAAFGNSSRFKPMYFVLASGVMNAIAALALAIYCLIQVLSMTSKKASAGSFVKAKLSLAIVAAVSTFAAAGMFAIQTDDFRRGFSVTKGASFFLVIVTIALTVVLSILGLFELKSAKDKETYNHGTIQLKQTRC